MKKLLRLALILCFVIGALTTTAYALTGAVIPTTEVIDNVVIYDNAFGEADKTLIEIKLDSGNGEKAVIVDEGELFYSEQRGVYVGLVSTELIEENTVTAYVYDMLPESFVYGNLSGWINYVDYSKSVNMADLNTMKLHLEGLTEFSESEMISADVDGNGLVNLTDLQEMKLFLENGVHYTVFDRDPATYSYGYVSALSPGSAGGYNSVPYVLHYTDSKGMGRGLPLSYPIEYDGELLSPTSGVAYLRSAAAKTNYDVPRDERSSAFSQIVKYSLDPTTGKIATISTVNNFASEYTEDRLNSAYLEYTENADSTYKPIEYIPINDESGYFDTEPKFIVNSSTTVFVVDRYQPDIGNIQTNAEKSTVAKTFSAGEKYLIELFDITGMEGSVAKACVVYIDETVEALSAATPLYIIDEITATATRNKAGEVGEKAEFYIAQTTFGSDTFTSADEGTFSGWGEGTVVKMLKNKYGDIRSEADDSTVVWDVTSPTMPEANEWINQEPSEFNGTAYRTVVGVIESFDPETGILVFIPSTDFASIDENSVRETYTIDHSSETNCGFVVYDPIWDFDPVYNITYEELEGNIITYEDDPENATEVLIHLAGTQSNLSPKLVYIINR